MELAELTNGSARTRFSICSITAARRGPSGYFEGSNNIPTMAAAGSFR
jgi:hypothetical protein